ncbi:MAG: Peptidase [Bradyrhizobium sp.]|nr:Peptidase [Bradyrhizobium sp.]
MRENVEFPADDVILRGWLFTPDNAKGPLPTVIVSHGFAAVKEQSLNEVGELFAAAGLAALVYDHRNHGESDGLPRGDIDPWAQVRDTRHAISFAETLEVVDSDRIGVWGTSYSGAHAIVVAAMDRRVKAGCAQVPMIAGHDMLQRAMDSAAWTNLLNALDEERRRWAKGEEPTRLTLVTKEPGQGAAFSSSRSYQFYHYHDAPTFRNELTLRSLDLTIEYDARAYIDRLDTTPFQFVIAEEDLATPSDLQLEAYSRIRGPKELVIIPGDHYTSYLEFLEQAANAAADFFARQLNRTMWDIRQLKS